MNNTVDNVIYQFWVGSAQLSPNRMIGLITTLANSDSKVCFVTNRSLADFILPDHPLHPAYQYLSGIHKSDYLKSYFMNFYGGGYADIKHYSVNNNWKECFKLINDDQNIEIIGQKEIPNGSSIAEYNSPENLEKVLANCYFICRPHTEFTEEWYKRVQQHMDERYEDLKRNPAIDEFGYKGGYPLRWAEVQCDIFHPTIMDLYDNAKMKNCLIPGRLDEPYR